MFVVQATQSTVLSQQPELGQSSTDSFCFALLPASRLGCKLQASLAFGDSPRLLEGIRSFELSIDTFRKLLGYRLPS